MPETDYGDLVQQAREAAALRLRRGQMQPGTLTRTPSRYSDIGPFISALLPQTPLDVALYAAGPLGKLGGKAAAAGGITLADILSNVDEAQAGPASAVRKLFLPSGLPRKGEAYSKAARGVLDEIAAGPKGAGPIDLSSAGEVPNVPQVELPRYNPPRGVSPRLQEALQNPDVISGVEQSIEAGRAMGADKWYGTEPVRRAFEAQFGPVEGPKRMQLFMDMVAATSPKSDVPTNIRNASFYYQRALAGDPAVSKTPYPYGHVGQKLHQSNYAKLMLPQPAPLSSDVPDIMTAWDVLTNPKPASFSQNLQGNLVPGTIDTHAFRNIGMRTGDPRFLETSFSSVYKPGADPAEDSLVKQFAEVKEGKDGKLIATFRPQQLVAQGRISLQDALNLPTFWVGKPNANEYGAAEQFYRELGRRQNLSTAEAQAAAWSGGGSLTGLGSPPSHTFPELLNERVLFTAKMRGEKPEQTLNKMLSGKAPLLAIPALAPTSELDLGEEPQ